ncbi:MAG: T9SS type A sorting domain-containing protein [Bacteroidia bacterium]|nr:T9SS type A sorting domain-containing protein [Bacteroidia bacterium]
MRHKNYRFRLISTFLSITLFAHLVAATIAAGAQTSLNAAGGNAQGSGGTVSYSAGQVFFSVSEGANGSLTAGIQQPYEISTAVSAAELDDTKQSVTIYPNPFTHYLTVKLEGFKDETLSCILLDQSARMLQKIRLNSDQTVIDMSSLKPAIYFLSVSDGRINLKTFRIIKH